MPESPAVPAARPTPSDPAELSAEDGKLVVLARGARGRIGAVEGAADIRTALNVLRVLGKTA